MTLWRSIAALLVTLACAEASATRVVVSVPAATPPNDAIYLAGSTPGLGLWKADGLRLARQPDGTYVADVDGPAEFKVTRGAWETVEKDGGGGEVANRRLEAGVNELRVTVARWAEGAAATTRASTVTGDLRIEQVGGRKIRVWLPPGYDAAVDRRYPVLYMHDGQNCFDAATSAFGVEWQVDETLTKLIAAKTIEPIIVVGIDNAGAGRVDEYTTTQDKGRGGKGEAYLRLVVDVVKRHVDATYRTRPGRADTFVGGSSLGGLISLAAIERHGETFAGAIVMSPSLWWNDEAAIKAIAARPPRAGTRVWLDMGGREGDEPVVEAARARLAMAALTEAGVVGRVLIDGDAQHNEAAWARRFPDAIRYLLSAEEPATKP